LKLREQNAIDTSARFVTGPKIVPKRLNDVIGRHTNMRRSFFQHTDRRHKNTGYGPQGWVCFLKPPDAVKMAKEFVRAVNEMNDKTVHRLHRLHTQEQGHQAGAGKNLWSIIVGH
jgi:hypothetical protein